jgi:hypothetical protein
MTTQPTRRRLEQGIYERLRKDAAGRARRRGGFATIDEARRALAVAKLDRVIDHIEDEKRRLMS